MRRFTLRDLFWLTLVVALALAWGVDRWKQELRFETTALEMLDKWEGERSRQAVRITELEDEVARLRRGETFPRAFTDTPP